jgi:hypothetical protein
MLELTCLNILTCLLELHTEGKCCKKYFTILAALEHLRLFLLLLAATYVAKQYKWKGLCGLLMATMVAEEPQFYVTRKVPICSSVNYLACFSRRKPEIPLILLAMRKQNE